MKIDLTKKFIISIVLIHCIATISIERKFSPLSRIDKEKFDEDELSLDLNNLEQISLNPSAKKPKDTLKINSQPKTETEHKSYSDNYKARNLTESRISSNDNSANADLSQQLKKYNIALNKDEKSNNNQNNQAPITKGISESKTLDEFIISTSANDNNSKNGLLNAFGYFIGCNSKQEVQYNQTMFTFDEELIITLVEGEENTYLIKSKSQDTYFSINDFVNGTSSVNSTLTNTSSTLHINTTAGASTPAVSSPAVSKPISSSALLCSEKSITSNTKLKIKKFTDAYYIETKNGYITFNGPIPGFTNHLDSDSFIYGAFNLPDKVNPKSFIPETLCRDLDCVKISLKFILCNKYLTASVNATDLLVTLNIASFKDNYLYISQGGDFITVIPDEQLSFLQTQTSFSLFKMIKVESTSSSVREIILRGYGNKYLSCNNGVIGLSDSITKYNKIGY